MPHGSTPWLNGCFKKDVKPWHSRIYASRESNSTLRWKEINSEWLHMDSHKHQFWNRIWLTVPSLDDFTNDCFYFFNYPHLNLPSVQEELCMSWHKIGSFLLRLAVLLLDRAELKFPGILGKGEYHCGLQEPSNSRWLNHSPLRR